MQRDTGESELRTSSSLRSLTADMMLPKLPHPATAVPSHHGGPYPQTMSQDMPFFPLVAFNRHLITATGQVTYTAHWLCLARERVLSVMDISSSDIL